MPHVPPLPRHRRRTTISVGALLLLVAACISRAEAAANDYYRLLGVQRDAPADEIKKAYRRAARRLHPDGTAPDPEAFMELSKAFETLSDDNRRAAYDASGGQPQDAQRPHYRHHYYHHQHRGWDPRWGPSFFSDSASDWGAGSLLSNPLLLAIAGVVILNVAALVFIRRGHDSDDRTDDGSGKRRQPAGASATPRPKQASSSPQPEQDESLIRHPAASALRVSIAGEADAVAPWQSDLPALLPGNGSPVFIALLPALPENGDVRAHAAACRPALARLASAVKFASRSGPTAVRWVLSMKPGAGSKGAAAAALHSRADKVLRRLLASGAGPEDEASNRSRGGCISIFAVAANTSCCTCKAAVCPVSLPLSGSTSASTASGSVGVADTGDFTSALDAAQGWALSVEQGNVNLRDRTDLLYASLFEGQ